METKNSGGLKVRRFLCVLILTILAGLNWLAVSQAADNFVIGIDEASRIYCATYSGSAFGALSQIDTLGGTNTRGVTINDFNNDGNMDFIAGRGISGTGYYYLFLNDGSNNFTKTSLVGTQGNANSWTMDMASGDFNNDGNMDFVANGNQSTVGIYLGDGQGHFTKTEVNWGANGRGMDTADFDNDGNLDVVRATNSDGYIKIYWGDGTGAFPTNTQIGDTGDDPYGVVAGDFDNDGYADVIANSGSGGDPYFFKGNGDRTFVAGVYVSSLDLNNHGGYDAFDYNGDGNLDVLIANYTGYKIYYYPGNGDGTFGAAVLLNTTNMASACMGISTMPIGPPAGVPNADITPVASTISEGGSVDFDGSGSTDSDGTITNWDWNFGDGGAGTDEDPAAHTYTDEGIYYPNLKVTDDDFKKDYDAALVIVEGDTPSINNNEVVFDETHADNGLWSIALDGANYASDTEGVASYEWNFEDRHFVDDFNDGNSDGWDNYAGTWVLNSAAPIEGAYSFEQTGTTLDRTENLFDRKYYNDVTVEADVKVLTANEHAYILFRAQNHQNYYEYILRGGSNNDVLLYKRTNGTETSLYDYNLPYVITNTDTYHIKIVTEGSRIDCWLNGKFLFSWYDSSFSSGKVGLSTYRTNVLFDNVTVTETATGQAVSQTFEPGTHNVELTATDSADQSATDTIPMTMAPGDPPVADAGGPYSAGESAAIAGGWTFSLDGSGSTDDVGIRKYVWDFGTDAFNGIAFQTGKWYANGGITQNDEVALTGVSTWDTRYMVTKALFPKVKGQVFQMSIKTPSVTSSQAMFGFKNANSTSFHYNQFPYEFYIYNGNVQIYENSSSRGATGYTYANNTWYDFRIELKDVGAVYYYKRSDSSVWLEVYNSSYATAETQLRKGIVVYSNTWSVDNFVETTAGETGSFTLFRGTGSFNADLTVYDRAGQCDTDGSSVTITSGAFPIANAGPDQTKGEADGVAGVWSVNFDASGSTDDNGIYTYEWDWNYDGSTFNPSNDTGATPSHSWNAPGVYTIAVRVTDNALQSHIDTMTVTIAQGDPPTADTGGPYTVDESTALGGGWTVNLDGSGSFDSESNLEKFIWNLGTDTFDGTIINDGKWYYSAGVTQNGEIALVGASSWGTRYLCSKDTFTRANGLAFEARVNHVTGSNAMIGFKNINTTSFQYGQMPYAIYFNGGNLYIYENGSNRGDTGYDYSYNAWYDVRIELKETQGARYYYRSAGSADWTLLYDSNNYTDTAFRKNIDVYSGTFKVDDLKEIAAGESPSYRFYELGSHAISLTVYDQANQSDMDSSSVTTSVNNPPAADAGGNRSGDELDAFEGTWTFDFDASGSTDDYGIFKYEWDWDNNGVFDETGMKTSHTFSPEGTHSVTLRVTDNVLQADTDTITVTLTTGNAPVAVAGPEITTEGYWPVIFNGGGSSDDFGIYKYEWDFGDYVDYINHDGPTSKGAGKTPRHIYWEPGDYPVTLTVYDNALQSDTDTTMVHVITGDAPVADAGGPYTAGAGGPPAYFNGSSSTDDYGIVKYLWDVDDQIDSDSDGDYTNDMDVAGRKPFYAYATAGTYTVTLTVEDGAGQRSSATTTVNVADNLTPNVICVPWRAGDPTAPHETYSGKSIRLKGIVRDAGTLQYRWDFGDGTYYPVDGTSYLAVSNKYAIEKDHIYSGSDGTPFTAVLYVKDSAGLVGSDNYYVIIRPNDYETKTNIAIDEGLWYVHKMQNSDGHWVSYGSYYSSATSSSVQSFEINGHLQDGDNQEDPYVETVNRGLAYMFLTLKSASINNQTYGDPDTNGNGIGVTVNSDRPIYEGGMAMDAIASSNTPLAFATTGGTDIKGRFYFHILTDMVDQYSWGQYDHATVGGGWRYSWGDGPDNSACQWAAIGMLAAEDNFGINIPQWVKDRNNVWLNYSYDGTGFGYTSAGNGDATTPSGMVQLAFDDKYTTDPRWRTAENYLANNWFWENNNYYGIYALVKSMRLAKPNPVITLSATGLDWYSDSTTGVRKRIVDAQGVSGTNWGSWASSGYGGRGLDTAWAVIMLTPSLFVQPPVADAGDDIIWAYDTSLQFNASGSFHMDPSRKIVKYEWDFDGDGTYDFTTSDPSDPNAKFTYPDPHPNDAGDLPQVFVAKLRVTDDNEPVQTDIDTREVTVAEPPHAPFANHGGPYAVTAGIPFTLNGSGSYDIDLGDSITLYQWDLDNDGNWFNDIDLETENKTASYTYNSPGVFNIGLKVWDNGAFNPVSCTPGVDCTPMESNGVYTTVTVRMNQPPTADAGGPYEVDEGAPLTLDGTGSSDPNGDTLIYAWDLDNDGSYDDSTDAQPSWTWTENGVYTVGLKVSDSLLEDTTTVEVTVNDLGPTAEFTWEPEPQQEGSEVSFTDTSTSSPDSITTWVWDFGGLGASSAQNPGFTFQDDGTYTVALTVTDDDGSVSTISHDVIITDKSPTACLTGDASIDEASAGNYDASCSSSSPDAIVSYEWDWNYDGSTFISSGDTGATQSHAWNANGTYTVAVRVTDDDGDQDIATLTVVVGDQAPKAAVTGDMALQEGQAGSYDASGSTSSPDTITSYEWDWNYNGSTFNPSGDTGVTHSHVFMDNGSYTVAVRVTDSDGSTDIATLVVTVSDLGPTAAVAGDATLNEGQTGNYSASGSTSSPDTITSYEWDWNYNGSTFSPSGDTGVTHSHLFTDNAGYTVAVRVTDDDGSTGIATLAVTVNDLGPTAALTGDTTLDEGQTGNYDASGSTSSPDAIVSYEWDWNYNGSTFNPSGDTGITQTHVWNSVGSKTVAVRVTDEDGSAAIATLGVTVNPSGVLMASLTGDTSLNEGQTGNYDASASKGPYPITDYAWDWNYNGSTFNPSGDTGAAHGHVWADNGAYTVAVRVTDDHGGTHIATLAVSVNNLAPVVNAGQDQTSNEAETVNFSGSFTDAGSLDTHTIEWNFGDGATASGSLTPSHVYGDNGTYTVTLIVTDSDGGVGSDTLTVTVGNAAPVVEAGSDQSVNEGSTVNFSGSFTDAGSLDTHTIEWNFGDGATASGNLTLSHVYGDNGTYTVTLTVTDSDGGVGSDTLTVTVGNAAPVVDAGSNQSVYEGGTVNFSGSFTDAGVIDTHTIGWDFGDGATGSGTLTPIHVYGDNGVYTVTLTVTDDGGSVGSDTLTVTVGNVAPVVDAGPDQTVNQGDTVHFNGSFTDPGSADTHVIDWTFGDGGSGSGSLIPAHIYNAAGTYTVTLTVTDDDGGVGSDSLNVTVGNDAPVVDAGGNQSVNEGDTVNFSGSFIDEGDLGGHTIGWTFGDGASVSGTLTPSHVYADNGIYTVTMTVTDDGGGVGSDTLTVTVSNVAPVVEAGSNQSVIEGSTVNFSGSFNDVGVLDTPQTATFQWNFGDGSPVSNALTPSHLYVNNGEYTVTFTVTDKDGGVGSDSMTVTVRNAAPVVDAGPDQTVNKGDTVNFTGSFTDAGSADTHTYNWNFGDSALGSGTLTPSHVYKKAGTYTVTLTVRDGDGGVGADTMTVTVTSAPPTCGDLDHDGDVDSDDRMVFMNAYRKHSGDQGYIAEADYDGDGFITLYDYREWYVCYNAYLKN